MIGLVALTGDEEVEEVPGEVVLVADTITMDEVIEMSTAPALSRLLVIVMM